VENAGRSADEARRVLSRTGAPAARLDSVEANARSEEGPEEPDGVRPATHARHGGVRITPGEPPELRPGLASDDGLKLANDRGIGVRAERGTEDVVRRRDVLRPIAHRLVDRVFERLRAGIDG
jgi:hypothetical protein